MVFSLSRAELIGRIGQDPIMRYTPGGQAVTTFSVATDRPAKPGVKPDVDWHECTAWERLAELCAEFASRGRLVYVAGRLQYRTFEGKDGRPRRTAEIVATDVIFLDRKPGPDLHVVGPDDPDQPD